MAFELQDLIGSIASVASGLVGAAGDAISAMYAAGAPDGLGPDGLAAGTAAAGAAAAAAAPGALDSRNDPATNPRIPAPDDDVGDATSPNQQLENSGGKPSLGTRFKHSVGNPTARQLQRWAEQVMGVDKVGTVPAGGKA